MIDSQTDLSGLPEVLKPVFAAKPQWVIREIQKYEAVAIAKEIADCGATSAIEIGVASGFSSTVILSALRANGPDATLSAFDLAEDCYFDTTKKTGQVLGEILTSTDGYDLKTGLTSADITEGPDPVDFLFIDAGHRHPWPTLDLISLSRFTKRDAVIGLHDVNWPLQARDAYRQNGPRDLIRAWVGDKRIYKNAINIGFVNTASEAEVFESICRALVTDWETQIDAETLAKYVPMVERFGASAPHRLAAIFAEKAGSDKKTQLYKL